MDQFDIARLTDFDFETLCKDLFEMILDEPIEIFARGADGGIDLRCLVPTDGTVVIQCKHWAKSDRSTFVRNMTTKEVVKVKRLNPRRYIIATSVDLTVAAKDALAAAFQPYLATRDIFGLQEIFAELRKRPNLVRRHLRLWLSSTAILQTLLNSRIHVRSRSLSENLQVTLQKYAPNPSLDRAQELLESGKVCIIAGIPGIGKTTLAQVLCANYTSMGYELYEVSSDIEEANRVWDDGVPQIFYYDDFLGQTTLQDRLQKNEDARLIDLMRRIRYSSNKRIVLTTRGYILEQARRDYERLARKDFRPLTCVLDLADYSEQVRAAILYNHIYFSSLPPQSKAIFAERIVHNRAIGHPNFNPRLIEDTLELASVSDCSPRETVDLLFENLDDPARVWDHVFHHQIDDAGKRILETLLFLRRQVTFRDLSLAWSQYRLRLRESADNRSLRDALKILSGTMVRLQGAGLPIVSFHNPSVTDYMFTQVSLNPIIISNVLRSAVFFEQLERVWVLSRSMPDLREHLGKNAELLERTTLRTFEAPAMATTDRRQQSETLHRINVSLNICNQIGSRALGRQIENQVTANDLPYIADDLEEVADIARALDNSPLANLRARAPELAERLANALTLDMTEWQAADRAVALLHKLGDLAPYGALQAAQVAREDSARRTIEQLANSGMGSTSRFDRATLAEILDYASEWDEPTAFAPHLPEVWESIEVVDKERELSLQLAAEEATGPPPLASDIATMFALLRTQDA